MILHEDADPGIDESFIYTADDERIAVIDNPTPSETWYPRDLEGQILRKFFRLVGDTDWQRDTIRRQGQVLATDTAGLGVHHAHLDHLGTIRLWTQPDTMVFSRHDYTAFGEEVIDNLDGQDQRYTGHERDIARSGGCSGTTAVDNQTIDTGQTFMGCDVLSSTNTTVTSTEEVRFKAGESVALSDFTVADGATFVVELDGGLNSDLQDLDYMHARHCSPVTGRFLSVDPVMASADPQSPQSWNRYSYVQNRPMSFIDPTGEVLFFFAKPGDLEELTVLTNQALHGVDLVIDDSGKASLVANDEVGPPSAQQAALAQTLGTAIQSSGLVGLNVVSGSRVMAGSALEATMDIADIAMFGDGPATTAASVIGHEVAESLAFQSAISSLGQVTASALSQAHLAGMQAQNTIAGSVRGQTRRTPGVTRFGTGVTSTSQRRGNEVGNVTILWFRGNIVKVFQ